MLRCSSPSLQVKFSSQECFLRRAAMTIPMFLHMNKPKNIFSHSSKCSGAYMDKMKSLVVIESHPKTEAGDLNDLSNRPGL